ncbi:type II toxin-antitoxin system RelE/ParE family toxin [Suipraeoptans intestinalis]|uniref:type II toxin-antitoxin system RelE/ParE family toxin n=1 Tax=Suipraeoptans intestinalis TaxID=2606628 RepID=UPI0023F25FA3|nr:type II toxin-antitoxin system RelE/ParE family toxin [Suipraeoptans intestinalis]MDD7769472.1 type II toxin-antitoxin system RelE/ParE family toxin [Suipraeoptans intestinalis]MDY3121886.1 type II toxin-antitoxin system RelE/ParE family toxin [Suipraeoptans intestinalis]
MDSYEIITTPDATTDLVELRDYIADVLRVPDTALSYIRSIREEISKLSEMPGRIKPVDDEPWHSRGIRKIMTKNSYVYYRIDEDAKRVYIMNVIYSRRDQLRQLANMKLD